MASETEAKIFKLEEVKEHNKSKGEDRSIWVVIHDKVYDITKFLDEVLYSAYVCFICNNSPSHFPCSILVVKRF